MVKYPEGVELYISNDESLWLKLNFYGGKVPYKLVEKAAENGYKYLSVAKAFLYYAPPPYKPLNLKYLEMSDFVSYYTNNTIHTHIHQFTNTCSTQTLFEFTPHPPKQKPRY